MLSTVRRCGQNCGQTDAFPEERPSFAEPTGRLELPTGGLRNRCSTTELRRRDFLMILARSERERDGPQNHCRSLYLVDHQRHSDEIHRGPIARTRFEYFECHLASH
jgi:hypothetical protein